MWKLMGLIVSIIEMYSYGLMFEGILKSLEMNVFVLNECLVELG